MRARLLAASLAASVSSVSAASVALGDVTKRQCIDANTQAQSLRRDGKLEAARAQLQQCGQSACPALVRADCARRLDDLESAQPTVIFDVRDGAGHDLVGVRVSLDGQPLGARLDGKALRVDPGAHTFVFTAAAQAPVTRTFVIRESEKERRERIVIGPVVPPSPPSAVSEGPAPATSAAIEEDASRGLGGQRTLGLVMGGIGFAGLGVGTVFGLLASSAWNGAKTVCGGDTSHCTNAAAANADRSTTQTDGTISTTAFVAGGALLVAGAVVFLAGRHHAEREPSPSAGVAVVPDVGSRQGGISIVGQF